MRISSSVVLITATALCCNAVGAIKIGLADKNKQNVEVVRACVPDRSAKLTPTLRQQIAKQLGWQDEAHGLCRGYYQQKRFAAATGAKQIQINADSASIFIQGRSSLRGNVEVSQDNRYMSANTAYIYRNPKNKQVDKIELIGCVRMTEPGRLMVAQRATINPQDNSGEIWQLLYRLTRAKTQDVYHRDIHGLTAWGRARQAIKTKLGDLHFDKATYTTCPPKNPGWQIQARKISLNKQQQRGEARDAMLTLHDWPVLYVPYLSFPTSNQRKSGFLMPIAGYTTQSGYDVALPYYWNMAENFDATLTPHYFSKRGTALGGEFRYLSEHSNGIINGSILPNDKQFKRFIYANTPLFPFLATNNNDTRWLASIHNQSYFANHLQLDVDVQQVSDDYYLQDFSNTLSLTTANQLPRQASLAYNDEHWRLQAFVQAYQTLHPINQTPTMDVYRRLPMLLAVGQYFPSPFVTTLTAQFDNFQWPAGNTTPEGLRYHLNPGISMPLTATWGFLIPSVQLQQDNYELTQYLGNKAHFNRSIPQVSVDGGLIFERAFGAHMTQTLEPRLYYLYVPFVNQFQIPVFDTTTYIFTYDQLFRTNRYAGFDRFGDANQLSYALVSRILNDKGMEKAAFAIGQIAYFQNRRVQFCQNFTQPCFDNNNLLGFLSPTAKTSPIAAKADFHINPLWLFSADIAWDPARRNTNNSHIGFHYQGPENRILNFGYSYLYNADITQLPNQPPQNNALHQINGAYAWPLNERWSSIGAYSYNIAKNYPMSYLFGMQYEDCCWAVRVIGGRVFNNLNNFNNLQFANNVQFSNNVFVQLLLKGLGSVASSDPTGTINTNIPGYRDIFR